MSIHGGVLQAFNIGTISGDIELGGQITPDGEYAIRTTSGDANLALPADTRCTVQVRTVSGDIDCSPAVRAHRESRRHMSLAINGGGPTVQFGSISGDLSISELSDVAGSPVPPTATRPSACAARTPPPGSVAKAVRAATLSAWPTAVPLPRASPPRWPCSKLSSAAS